MDDSKKPTNQDDLLKDEDAKHSLVDVEGGEDEEGDPLTGENLPVDIDEELEEVGLPNDDQGPKPLDSEEVLDRADKDQK